MLDMLDLLMKRRTIRRYQKGVEVEKEKVDKIIKAALTSPSGKNIRPWELIVVNDMGILSKLGDSRGPASKHMGDAALGIVIVSDPSLTDIWIEDASIISTVIQITAESLGLGSGWIQIRERKDKDGLCLESSIKEILKLPDDFRVESMIAIGYPDEQKEPHDEAKLPMDKVHYNTY